MSAAFDMAFADAVRQAAQGDGRGLRDWLLSDKPIGPGERALMADFLCPDPMPQKVGRKSGKFKVDLNGRRAAILDYRQRMEAGEAEKSAAAAAAAAADVSVRTLRDWNKKGL